MSWTRGGKGVEEVRHHHGYQTSRPGNLRNCPGGDSGHCLLQHDHIHSQGVRTQLQPGLATLTQFYCLSLLLMKQYLDLTFQNAECFFGVALSDFFDNPVPLLKFTMLGERLAGWKPLIIGAKKPYL